MKPTPVISLAAKLRRQLRTRWRLLTAAFGRLPVTANGTTANDQPIALLNGLNTAAESAGMNVWDWDVEHDVLKFNRNLAQFYGADADEVEANPREFMQKFIHPEDREHYFNEFTKALKGKQSLDIQYRVQRRDGSIRPLRLVGEIYRASSGPRAGRATRVVGVTIDMSAHAAREARIAEQAQRQSELLERISLANETASVGMWDWDLLTGKLSSDTNMAAIFKDADLSGVTRAEDFISCILHPDDRKHFIKTFATAVQDGSTERVSLRFRYMVKDGGVEHAQLHGRILRDTAGRALRFLGVSWNNTAQIKADEEIARQAREQNALVERLHMAGAVAGIDVWDWDLVTDKFTVETHMTTLHGTSHLEYASGRELVARAIHQDDVGAFFAALDGLSRAGDTLQHFFRMLLPDGTMRHARMQARVFRDEDGKAIRLLGVTLDRSDELERHAALQRQTEEERALRDRLNLATGTAGIAIWDQDMVTGALAADDRFRDLFGIERDTPSFRLQEGIHADVRQEMLGPLRDAFADPTKSELSIRHRTSNPHRDLQYVQTHMRVFRDEQGRPARILGVTWDVTDEVQHAEELKRQAEKERALVERLNVSTHAAGISPWEFDLKNGCFSWCGQRPKAFEMDDVPLNEYYARINDRVVAEDRHLMMEPARDAILNGRDSYQYRFRFRANDGTLHHMQNFAQVIRSDRGNVRYCVGVTWDVTKEVEATEQLHKRAEENRQLIERLNIATDSASIGSWEMDLVAQRFMWVDNPVKTLGIAPEDFGALAEFSEHIVPEDRHLLAANIKQAVKDGSLRMGFRYRAYGQDGGIVHIQTFGRIFVDADNRPIRSRGVSWDATNLVESEEKLQAQAQQERKLLERLNIATHSAGISSWEIDLKARKFLWIENPIQAARRAEDGDDLAADLEYFNRRVVPDDQNLMREAIRNALAQNTDRLSYRYRVIGENGGIVHLQTYARVILDESQKPNRVLGVSWDVTREVEAAEQLRHQTERLRDVERRLERASLSSSEGHWEADVASGHLWCSSSFHTLLGFLEGEIETRVSALDRLVHDDDRSMYLEALRNHLTSNDKYDIETRLRTAKGDYRWFRMRGMAERDDQGRPVVMAGSIHDIHQQKEIEDALKLAQRRFERAINGTQDGLWELDLVTDNTWCSPRLAVLLGYPPQALEGTNIMLDNIHPDDVDKARSSGEAHFRLNIPFDIELRLKNRGGDYRWYRARATAERNTDGRAVRLSGSLQDVTEARAARQELLRATEAAEAANRAKSAFLANVSHEIRTPMNGIIGMTGLMLDTQLDRTQREYADTIRTSADSLLSVINDILDFSKIEAGKLDLETIDMDLREHVENIGSTMAFQAASKGLELIVNVHPEVPDRVRGDPQRLRQCLINLLGNAIKFTETGSVRMRLEAPAETVGRPVTVSVEDTGPGIPPEQQPRLFEAFARIEPSSRAEGSGLGLHLSHKLAEALGGNITLDSLPRKGSVFRLHIGSMPP